MRAIALLKSKKCLFGFGHNGKAKSTPSPFSQTFDRWRSGKIFSEKLLDPPRMFSRANSSIFNIISRIGPIFPHLHEMYCRILAESLAESLGVSRRIFSWLLLTLEFGWGLLLLSQATSLFSSSMSTTRWSNPKLCSKFWNPEDCSPSLMSSFGNIM